MGEKNNKVAYTKKERQEYKKSKQIKHAPCQLCQRVDINLFTSPNSKTCQRCEQSTKKCIKCGTTGSWKDNIGSSSIFSSKNSSVCNKCELVNIDFNDYESIKDVNPFALLADEDC